MHVSLLGLSSFYSNIRHRICDRRERQKRKDGRKKGAHHLGQVMSPLDPLNEIGYMPPPSNLEDQIQLTPTIFGAPF